MKFDIKTKVYYIFTIFSPFAVLFFQDSLGIIRYSHVDKYLVLPAILFWFFCIVRVVNTRGVRVGGRWRTVYFWCMGLTLGYIFISVQFRVIFPTLIHLISDKSPASVVLNIIKPEKSNYFDPSWLPCHGGITVLSDGFFNLYEDSVCGLLSQSDWNRVASGTRIQIHGLGSSTGMTYTSYEIITDDD